MRRGTTLLLCLALAGCSRRYERPVTAWCKVLVREPEHLGGGMIQAGPDARETLLVRGKGMLGERWVEVARGSGGRILRLAEDRAILFEPALGAEAQVVTPDGTAAPMSRVFPCDGFRTVSPDGRWIDCGRCAAGTGDCRSLSLERVSPEGTRTGSTTIEEPDASCRFRRAGVLWYDRKGRAYALASCASGSRVLFRTGFTGDPERFTAPGGNENETTWHDAIGRFELLPPKPFQPLRGRPNASIQR